MDMGDGGGLARRETITNRGSASSPIPQKGNTMQTIETILFTATWLFIGGLAVVSLI